MAEKMTDLTTQCLDLPRTSKERLIRVLKASIEKEDEMKGNDGRFNLLLRAATEVCGDKILTSLKDFNLVMGRRVIALMMKQDGYSYHEIGKYLKRDHSSIHYAVKKMREAFDLRVEKELKYWYDFIQKVEEYEKEMESNVV